MIVAPSKTGAPKLVARHHAELDELLLLDVAPGANFEFSYNARWDSRRYSSEIRPIIGWHIHPWDFIFTSSRQS